ncbi:MAG: serpin family protein [Phycisphaerales bacterium]|nr:MAG: serpin family protein [Phycisphaerales bacterium]
MRTFRTILVLVLAGTLASNGRAGEPAETMAKVAPNLVVEANNRFALQLYQQLRTSEGNLFFSPYSVSAALAMTYAGAAGQTEKQMAETLCLPTSPEVLEQMGAPGTPMTQEEFAEAFGAIIKALNAQAESGSYQLSVANALWGQAGYAFLPAFTDLVETEYGGRLREMDFVRAAEQARQTINAWVARQTNDKIRDLIARGILGATTRLVLTNAIYFKGNWARQFEEKRTRPEPFTLLDGDEIQTAMMNQKAEFRYAQVGANDDSPLQVLELPYVDEALSMVILLPGARNGITQLEAGLNAEKLTAWLSRVRKREVKVTMPKFKMTRKFSLQRVLAAMGMRDAFSTAADFSGMTGGRDLFISDVIHQAYVDVNEEGTEAAAATGVVMKLTSAIPDQTPIFRADHPFVFLIRDSQSGSILFLGRVMNPNVEK